MKREPKEKDDKRIIKHHEDVEAEVDPDQEREAFRSRVADIIERYRPALKKLAE